MGPQTTNPWTWNKGPSPCQCQKQLSLVTQVQGKRGFVISIAGPATAGNNPAFSALPSRPFPPLTAACHSKRRTARGTPPELAMLQQLHLHPDARLQNSFPELGQKSTTPAPTGAPSHCQHTANIADRLTISVPSRTSPPIPCFGLAWAPKLSPESVA
jgi:hypothetical protein